MFTFIIRSIRTIALFGLCVLFSSFVILSYGTVVDKKADLDKYISDVEEMENFNKSYDKRVAQYKSDMKKYQSKLVLKQKQIVSKYTSKQLQSPLMKQLMAEEILMAELDLHRPQYPMTSMTIFHSQWSLYHFRANYYMSIGFLLILFSIWLLLVIVTVMSPFSTWLGDEDEERQP